MKQIKIITAVDRIPVTSLQGMTRISKTSVRLPSGICWEPLAIKPHENITDNQLNEITVSWSSPRFIPNIQE